MYSSSLWWYIAFKNYSGVFIVNFKQISRMVDFEQVSGAWNISDQS